MRAQDSRLGERTDVRAMVEMPKNQGRDKIEMGGKQMDGMP